ncbi:hypothetical protein TorRG33x02_275640 [Trema orientale]|uniref:Pentatricopeptide repeat n=1 Tax=Trema orientale TaxID=63057 RepID=A0A2P5CRR9_TREOI|nr:hypothetical protein TorRG33x02_275640 [Trema orientale]
MALNLCRRVLDKVLKPDSTIRCRQVFGWCLDHGILPTVVTWNILVRALLNNGAMT